MFSPERNHELPQELAWLSLKQVYPSKQAHEQVWTNRPPPKPAVQLQQKFTLQRHAQELLTNMPPPNIPAQFSVKQLSLTLTLELHCMRMPPPEP